MQDLESAIVVLSDRLTPFRDRVGRMKGEGLAHLWNQRTSLGTTANGPQALVNLFYSDGNLPSEDDPIYVQQTAAYKYLGTTVVITGPMILQCGVMQSSLNPAVTANPDSERKGNAVVTLRNVYGYAKMSICQLTRESVETIRGTQKLFFVSAVAAA